MSNFRTINRDTAFLLPPSVDEWLPDRHLARFVVEVIDGLDLSELVKAYRGSGSASYHPAMLLGLLVYGYSTKVFSSRAIERATHDSVAFRFIAGNEHPDHDTIAAFRKRFLGQIEALFIDVLKLARTMGLLKLGTVALDGTKVHANASRHSALSYGHARKIEKQLKREVQQLLRLAEQADTANIPDGMSIPEELERREVRLAAMAEAKSKIEARAGERLEREQAEHQVKLAARDEQERRTGRKPPGRPPAPPTGGAREKDQVNLTDEDSRIMKVAGGGFDQCYNAQAVVATGSLLIVAAAVTQAANDKEQLLPMIEKLQALPKELGRTRRILADSGYLSQSNVEQCTAAGIEPLIAMGRSRHHVSWKQRFTAAPKSPPESATPMQKMAHRLKTPRGRKLYALRKQTPEPVFGIIKSVMGYRQCLLRGLNNVSGEWNLVSMSWNIKRMFAMQPG
ncbi:MAG: IS1182 family transposase [Steroidobacteraceae bacterium]|nr:IS1182 family transposase [Pseudomonadota bacterium]HQW10449.1 IS1182 family transposase [Steroidobacteraceae bacterium]